MKNNIFNKITNFINKNDLLCKGERILLSLSAGKDSMALLDFILYLQNDFDLEIAVFHLNHLMRGEESDEDERFLLNIAKKKGIDIFIERYDFKNEGYSGESFEEHARQKRYEIADKICLNNGFQKIATAHNSDDNIETILMRIFTGTGVQGLTGIGIRRNNIIRPLLSLSSKEIYKHLQDNKIPWREDLTNSNNRYLRNYIRNIVLPKIYERFGGAHRAALSLSEISKEYISLIDDLLFDKYNKFYEQNRDGIFFELKKYIDDKRIFKYILSKIIREYIGGYVNWGMLEEIYKKAKADRSNIVLYENKNLLVKKVFTNNKKIIIISRNAESINNKPIPWEYRIDLNRIPIKGQYLKEINVFLSINFVDYGNFIKNFKKINNIFIAFNNDIRYIIIRNRRKGDRINLEIGYKKIKKLMIEKKLDDITKEALPLLVVNSEVAAFIPGFVTNLQNRVSVDFLVKRDSKKILAITME